MAITWTKTKPKKPYTLQFYDNFYASFLINGMLAIGGVDDPFTFTLTENWGLYRTGLGGPALNTLLGKGYLVRHHVYVTRIQTRFVGGGNGIEKTNQFFDDSLDDKLGGEYQRLGG